MEVNAGGHGHRRLCRRSSNSGNHWPVTYDAIVIGSGLGGLTAAALWARRERWMDALVACVDRVFPRFAGPVMHREMSTALTMHRELSTPGGAVYEFAASNPPHGIPSFPSPRTPVEGLWLASAYLYGGGYSGAMMSGAGAAKTALRKL